MGIAFKYVGRGSPPLLCWYCFETVSVPDRDVVPTIGLKSAEQTKAHLLDIPDAASFLGLTAWQMRGLLANGELKCVRVGRKIYFRRASLIKWAELCDGRYQVER
jgi:excisionase family DNA binding protein